MRRSRASWPDSRRLPTPTTVTGDIDAPLTIADALLTPAPATTNNWGVDRDYALGMIQTWNATVTKNFTQDWTMQVGYTGVKGTDLDILRAPALGANGVPIPETQAFIWESSGGRSLMNAANVQVRRRLAGGLTGGAVVHLRPRHGQRLVARRRRRGRRAKRQGSRGRIRALHLRAAAADLRQPVRTSCRGGRTGDG